MSDVGGYGRTRATLHRVAAHVLGRRRFDVCGKFGLRATPGGFATPAFQDGFSALSSPSTSAHEWPETIRVSGVSLVREVGAAVTVTPIPGATLRDLAHFAGADVDSELECGKDTPPVGDPDEQLELDPAHARTIADWCALAWPVLDEVLASFGPQAEPATLQLWPEHLDVGTHVGLAHGERINLGFSPGDGYEAGPYAYVGPWGSQRPGDQDFWNAPFGAVLRASDVAGSGDIRQAALAFLRAGIRNAARAEARS